MKDDIAMNDVKHKNHGGPQSLLQYKHLITPGKKSMKYIEDMLVSQFSAVKMPFSELGRGLRRMTDINIAGIIMTKGLNYTVRETEPAVYLIPRNERTAEYYARPYRAVSFDKYVMPDEKRDICVILEHATEYVYCGSNKLFLEIKLALGVDKEDYDNNTDELLCYLADYVFYYIDKKY